MKAPVCAMGACTGPVDLDTNSSDQTRPLVQLKADRSVCGPPRPCHRLGRGGLTTQG